MKEAGVIEKSSKISKKKKYCTLKSNYLGKKLRKTKAGEKIAMIFSCASFRSLLPNVSFVLMWAKLLVFDKFAA